MIKNTIIIFYSFIAIQILNGNDKKINFNWLLYEEIQLEPEINQIIWSKPSEKKSPRITHYSKVIYESDGITKNKFFNKSTGKIFLRNYFDNSYEYLSKNKESILRISKIVNGESFESLENEQGKKQYQIMDLDRNLLSTVQFNSKSIEFFAPFDEGQYVGIDYLKREIHLVIPHLNIYKVFPVPLVPQGLEGDFSYNALTKDIYINFQHGRFHILFDVDGNIVWQKTTNTKASIINSKDGSIFALFRAKKEVNSRFAPSSGIIEIFSRNGQSLCEINTSFSIGRDFFTPDNSKLIITAGQNNIFIYNSNSGKLLNNLKFNQFKPIQEVKYNDKTNSIYVIHNKSGFWQGESYLSVFPIDCKSNLPLWERSLGDFNRKENEFPTFLGISYDGTEITALSQGIIRIFKME